MNQKHIAIFASGGGSNAVKIFNYFHDNPFVSIVTIVANNPKAGVLFKPEFSKIDKKVIDKNSFKDSTELINYLSTKRVDLIVLAGFLWKIPKALLTKFPNRIINIHPALLPKYGGKGMYGRNVHEAVWRARDTESGMTVHYVNEKYDAGAIIFQSRCNVNDAQSAEEIGKRVLRLEHKYYPQVIEQVLFKRL